jgi:hypothetical protein
MLDGLGVGVGVGEAVGPEVGPEVGCTIAFGTVPEQAARVAPTSNAQAIRNRLTRVKTVFTIPHPFIAGSYVVRLCFAAARSDPIR